MSIRALDILDLPTLHHHRNEVLGFDTARTLTKGNPLAGMGLMSHIMSPTRHIYGAIAQRDGAALLGGIYQTRGEPFAKLLYLAPASRVDHKDPEGAILNQIRTRYQGEYKVLVALQYLEQCGHRRPRRRHRTHPANATSRRNDVQVNQPAPADSRPPQPTAAGFFVATVTFAALLAAFWSAARLFDVEARIGGGFTTAFVSFALLFAPFWFFGFGLPASSSTAFTIAGVNSFEERP